MIYAALITTHNGKHQSDFLDKVVMAVNMSANERKR